ncbi:MAG TPA: PEP-CTERM sorting domain-containing protein [Albitalea sp.]|nr:PEP-CTERM sorting domain-containing protein [Albitalea sp.]
MNKLVHLGLAAALAALSSTAMADLTSAGTWSGHVGLSVDGIGSNNAAVGDVQANIPVGSTILKAYLYSAGTPSPWYAQSPTTLAQYNAAGITLAGTTINNFDTLVGAISTRADIGRWYTARADVTSLVQSLTAGAASSAFSWAVTEGQLNQYIDGEVLAIVYSNPGLATASVALLNGGQNTGGETSTVHLGTPLTDPTDPSFAARLGLGISFSCCDQRSTIKVNGNTVTDNAGNNDDGLVVSDGSLITVGGVGDTPANNQSYANDHELYDLAPFLHTGDTSFSIFTQNPTNDDNIFFASLYLTGDITSVTPSVPEPETYALMLAGLAVVGAISRRRRAR